MKPAKQLPASRQPLPLADVWAVNLPDVLLALVKAGTRRVVLELASEPDAAGNVRLLVRQVADADALPAEREAQARLETIANESKDAPRANDGPAQAMPVGPPVASRIPSFSSNDSKVLNHSVRNA